MFSWTYRCLAPSTSKVTHITRFHQITFIPSQSISFDHFTMSYIPNRCLNSALDSLLLIDGQLSMASHVVSLCRSWLFQLRQLGLVWSSLTSEAAKTLVHAFISNSLDYCNSLLYGIGDGRSAEEAQTVQNSAVRVVTFTRKLDHITPVYCATSTCSSSGSEYSSSLSRSSSSSLTV